eukprot:CAMPEP_0181524506 /NCGR_PEP_ID=MMETSP1110-20121109/68469_1 /TAXON_ID=174948 /ORGANISM="Symbiodinium sp., Strain CCMP421" /LENGTH=151 /DNA_ID=CAMNT_0023655245 /DNA_START=120 /DNA_END=576 /DNA_ORIENTATION=+
MESKTSPTVAKTSPGPSDSAAGDPEDHQQSAQTQHRLVSAKAPGAIGGLAVKAKGAIHCAGVVLDVCQGVRALTVFRSTLVRGFCACWQSRRLAGIAGPAIDTYVHKLSEWDELEHAQPSSKLHTVSEPATSDAGHQLLPDIEWLEAGPAC